ncbi:hypothetical protein JST97_04030 [bacterium]|nr:hypothetical protein [bacterium]
MRWLALVALAALLLVRIHNALDFPEVRGFDANGHLVNLLVMQREGRWAHNWESWSGYHPPLFTWLACVPGWLLGQSQSAWTFACGRWLSTMANLSGLAIAWVALKRLQPGSHRVAVLMLGLVPGSILTSCMCYNVELAGFWLALLWCLMLWAPPWKGLRQASFCGLVCGLAILSRLEALAALGVIAVLGLSQLRAQPGRVLALTGLSLVMALGCASPIFLKNLAENNRPLISNVDPQLFPYPYQRADLLVPDVVNLRGWLLPEVQPLFKPYAPQASGNYLTMTYLFAWSDYLGVLERDPWPPIDAVVACAGLLFFGLWAWGWTSGRCEAVWFWATGFCWAFYLAYNLVLCQEVAVKSCYVSGLSLPFAQAVARGHARLSPPLQKATEVFACLLALVVAARYWC